MTNYSPLAKAEDEATKWAILLVDEPDSVDVRNSFQAWLEADGLHAEVWAHTLELYKLVGGLHPTTHNQWPQVPANRSREKHTLFGMREIFARLRVFLMGHTTWRGSLVGIAVAVIFVTVSFPYLNLHLSADYVSGTGEQQIHMLEDGSKLYLAPKSAVDVSYSDSERVVKLLKGSAFFEVLPHASKPFRVDAGDTKATVLGTSFRVRRSSDGVTVSVADGTVRVDDFSVSPALTKNLIAGDQVVIRWGEDYKFSKLQPADITRSRSGELIIRNLPAREVVEAFRDYYNGFIFVAEPFASQRVTGFYMLNNPVKNLTDLAKAHGANVQQITPWLLVIK